MAYINVDEVYILDNTGLQVDMATDIPFVDAGFTDAQKEQARANIGAGGTNPNLLDNPWFTVNQRDATTVSTNQAYIADRWKTTYGSGGFTATRNADGTITVEPTLSTSYGAMVQVLPTDPATALKGKVATGSVMMSDGTIISGTVTLTSSGSQDIISNSGDGVSLVWNANNNNLYLRSHTEAHTFKAVKLELGTVSTLANDAPPDYGTELLKCMRYFVRLNAPYTGNGFAVGRATTDGTGCRVFFPLPVPLRTSPTIAVNSIGNLRLFGNGSEITPSAASYSGRSENGVSLAFTATGLTGNHIYMLCRYSSEAYIDLSADL